MVKEILAGGRLKCHTTFMPLENMHSTSSVKAEKILSFCEGRAWLAKSLIQYDPRLEPVMDHVFGCFFIAINTDTAKRIAMGNNF